MIQITRRSLADCALLFLFTAVLIKPLFKLGFTDKWGSVEGAIISDARFLSDHWPHPSWQPLWYAGARFDSLFPPAVRYGTVAIAKISRVSVVRAYHIYSGLFYCFGIAGVYFLTWTMSGSRGAAWFGAAAAALVSPCFLFIPELRNDAWLWVPQRLGSMMRYGDGPHIASLAALPFALAYWWRALVRFRRTDIILAVLSSSGVIANSLAGAAVLLILLPVMAWSLYVTHLDRQMWIRAAIIGAWTWGLNAFWLVPSVVKVSIGNTQFLYPGGTTWSLWIALACSITFVLITNAKFRGHTDRAYPIFLAGATTSLALNVIGHYYFRFHLAGAPMHQAAELDLFLILLTAECLRRLPWPTASIAIATIALCTSAGYVGKAWHVYPADLGFRDRPEYKVQEWMSQHLPGARSMVAGSPRFWFDAWGDRMQLGGESESGAPERTLGAAQYQILNGSQPAIALLWMQILGADAIVTDPRGKFAGVLEELWTDGTDSAIYRVPRRFPGLARVVNTDRLNGLRSIVSNNDVDALKSHYELLENGPDSNPQTEWEDTGILCIGTHIEAGQSLIVQTMHDNGWHAYSSGNRVPLRKSALGFIRLDPSPGDHEIRLVFETPMEALIGRVIAFACALGLIAMQFRARREAV